jgi:phage shock protein PspC (stress-responsive transcriptional regulator)
MSDTIDPTTTTTTVDDAPTRRLVRVHEGRWVGGVAAGLGRYFDVNPLVYRIAFAALAFAGGTGILLYLAAVLVIPAEDREESIAVEALRRRRDQPWLLVGVGLLSFGALSRSRRPASGPTRATSGSPQSSREPRSSGGTSPDERGSPARSAPASQPLRRGARLPRDPSPLPRAPQRCHRQHRVRRLVPLHPLCDGVRVLEVGRSRLLRLAPPGPARHGDQGRRRLSVRDRHATLPPLGELRGAEAESARSDV